MSSKSSCLSNFCNVLTYVLIAIAALIIFAFIFAFLFLVLYIIGVSFDPCSENFANPDEYGKILNYIDNFYLANDWSSKIEVDKENWAFFFKTKKDSYMNVKLCFNDIDCSNFTQTQNFSNKFQVIDYYYEGKNLIVKNLVVREDQKHDSQTQKLGNDGSWSNKVN